MSRAPSRTSSYANQQQDAPVGQDASLLGAHHAFVRPKSIERHPSKSYAGSNGALAAASLAGGTRRLPSPVAVPLQSQITNPGANNLSSSPAASSVSSAVGRASSTGSNDATSLIVPDHGRAKNSRSPSQQAAVLAASRLSPRPPLATSPPKAPQPRLTLPRSMKPAAPPKPRKFSRHSGDKKVQQDPADTRESVTALLNTLDRSRSNVSSAQNRPEPIVIKPERSLAISSPKPIRASDGISSLFQMELHQNEKGSGLPAEPISETPPNIHPPQDNLSSDGNDAYVSAPENAVRTPGSARRRSGRAPKRSLDLPLASFPRPIVNDTTQAEVSPVRQRASTTTAPISIPSSLRKDPSPTVSSPQSARSLAAQWHQMNPRRQTPLKSGDDLANALVASSLASSRQPSPNKLDVIPPPSKKHHGFPGFSRSPSPRRKGMRHTLREPDSSTEDEGGSEHPYRKHRKKRLVRKHPHKHHEGDRKRWRDAVTEHERKRYEGVWAANRGLHCSFSQEEQVYFTRFPTARSVIETQSHVPDEVSSLVVRDVWTRSRLPEHALEVIWDLVDSRMVGRLSREEFVVGMWLVDQRLKGRKLPTKVSDSVWVSVTGIGIKVRK